MAILNFLKKTEESKEEPKNNGLVLDSEEKIMNTEKKVEVSHSKTEKKAKNISKGDSVKNKKELALAHMALLSPHITEKGTNLSSENKYIFKISDDANKIEVKKAVESVYGVNVVEVRIINIPKKKRRVGKSAGWKKGYKKAIIKIKEGQKIEILSH